VKAIENPCVKLCLGIGTEAEFKEDLRLKVLEAEYQVVF
jgi:hypothetical protein